jgi:hypothetical protein
MAEVAPEHIRTVDDLHQILVGKKLSPFAAREEILKLLRTGELLIDQHIKTPDNVDEPVVNITEPVSPQAWGRTLDLEIDGHHLIVGFLAAFDFPWQFYSFSVVNPAAIEGLDHPTPTQLPADTERPSQDATMVAQLEWALDRLDGTDQLAGLRGKRLLKRLCKEVGPDFTAGMTTLKEAKRRHRQKVAKRRHQQKMVRSA